MQAKIGQNRIDCWANALWRKVRHPDLARDPDLIAAKPGSERSAEALAYLTLVQVDVCSIYVANADAERVCHRIRHLTRGRIPCAKSEERHVRAISESELGGASVESKESVSGVVGWNGCSRRIGWSCGRRIGWSCGRQRQKAYRDPKHAAVFFERLLPTVYVLYREGVATF
jgi:hypothetical protein